MSTLSWELSPRDAADRIWDVIVIGTGPGGSTAGFNLARLGRSVLFLERGKLLHHDPTVVRGVPFNWTHDVAKSLEHGWWPHPLHRRAADDQIPTPEGPPIGAGTGGSTSQFAAVMDRFRPSDFTPRKFFQNISDTTLPDEWPVAYDEMVPFYARAERLFRVRGTPDPLAPAAENHLLEPLPPSAREVAVFDRLRTLGLNPYRIHSAVERVPGCDDCFGMLCPNRCRNDAARMCLYPAVESHGAKVVAECNVVKLQEQDRKVTRAICERDGEVTELRARIFILAANAFLTPALLIRSANERFPNGLANSSGLVGRNLMLHVTTHMLMKLKRAARGVGDSLNHGVSLNDYYVRDGTKLGNIHAHPVTTRSGILTFMAQFYRGMGRLPAPILSAVASIGSRIYGSWTNFSTVVEDLPYVGNFVTAKPGTKDEVVYTYRYPDELRSRARTLYDSFRSVVRRDFAMQAIHTNGALNRGHVCGTCRFGNDPRTSVLNRDNRAHDLENLYVLDASFFPSSGGINPSLTIVANSLRVTDQLGQAS